MPNHEDRRSGNWHLDKKFAIGVIGAMLLQALTFGWYAGQEVAERHIDHKDLSELKIWREKQDNELSKLSSQESSQGQKLDDLVTTVHHTDDIIERYFYRK